MGHGGKGESTLLSLGDAKGDPTGINGLACRDATGNLIRTGKAKQRDLNDFPGFALKWDRFNAVEITRGGARRTAGGGRAGRARPR